MTPKSYVFRRYALAGLLFLTGCLTETSRFIYENAFPKAPTCFIGPDKVPTNFIMNGFATGQEAGNETSIELKLSPEDLQALQENGGSCLIFPTLGNAYEIKGPAGRLILWADDGSYSQNTFEGIFEIIPDDKLSVIEVEFGSSTEEVSIEATCLEFAGN